MRKSILVLSLGALLFTSCKKEKEPVVATKENLSGSYKFTAVTYGGVNIFNNSDESVNMFEACQRDDVYTLGANGVYSVADAGTVCNPSSEYEGNWEFVNSTTVTIDGDTGTIKSWDGKTLVVEAKDNGIALVTTMVKQ